MKKTMNQRGISQEAQQISQPGRRRMIAAATALGGSFAMGIAPKLWAQQKPEKISLICVPNTWLNYLKQEAIPAWERETGIKVEVVVMPQEALKTRLRTEFNGNTARYDIVLWTAEWRGWIHRHLEDHIELFSSGSAFDWDDIPEPARKMGSYKDKQLGVPYRFTDMILHYQPALLEAAGISQPPSTFAELQRAAELTTVVGQAGQPDRYGLGIFGKQGGAIVNGWIPYLFSAGGNLYDEETYKIRITEPAAVESLQFYGDLVANKVTPPEAMTWEWDEIIAGGQNDRYAMSIMHAPYGSDLQSGQASNTKSRWAWSQMPGAKTADQGRSWILGWMLSVPTSSPNKGWAAHFLKFATSKEQMRKSMSSNNLPPRASILRDPDVLKSFPWAPEAAVALDRAWQVPGDEMWDALEQRLRSGVSEVLLGSKDAKRALGDVATDWARLLKRAGITV